MGDQASAYRIAKKKKERRVIEAARGASEIIPAGELRDFDEPDFKLETSNGLVGIEITAVMPTPYSNCFSSPLAEKSFREDVVQLAEKEYYRRSGAVPVSVDVYFWKIERGTDKRVMSRALADFVWANPLEGRTTKLFSWRPDLPTGFAVISITEESQPWKAFESLELNVHQIHQQIAARTRAKNSLLRAYRSNLPDSPIWLLLHSGADITTGVPFTADIGKLEFPFDFDRVLFFSARDADVVELRKGPY